MVKRLVFLAFTVAISCSAIAQDLPAWTMQLPKAGNATYMYVSEYALGDSESEARNQAMVRVFHEPSYGSR